MRLRVLRGAGEQVYALWGAERCNHDRRLFVRAVPYAAGSPRGYLADFVKVFQDRHRVGSVPASRLPACGPHSPPSQRRSMPPTGPSGRYTASRGSSHRPGAAPRAPGPTLSPAARRDGRCASGLCGAGPAAHHATSTHQCLRRQCHIQPDLCHRHRSSRCLRAASTAADTARPIIIADRCFLLGYVTLSRRRRNPHRSSRELLPERQVQSTWRSGPPPCAACARAHV